LIREPPPAPPPPAPPPALAPPRARKRASQAATDQRAPGWGGDRLDVFVFPDYRPSNPYQTLCYDVLGDHVTLRYATIAEPLLIQIAGQTQPLFVLTSGRRRVLPNILDRPDIDVEPGTVWIRADALVGGAPAVL